ncbi:MAG: hypothetical protein LKI53_01675 [Bacteroidales bacterium]|jgi:hypothetical protein|nr:hypothetical protein [Bacteroidales bacterium]
MATDPLPLQEEIISLLKGKSCVKAQIFNQTSEIFSHIKEILSGLSNDLNDMLEDENNRRIRLEYRDRGKFEAEIRFADDVLLFSMYTDVFKFDRKSAVWHNPYINRDPLNAYFGIINVYDFLYDSFKYDRQDDPGYLVARMFVNREKYFFVEGKRQKRNKIGFFGKILLDEIEMRDFILSAMRYALSFDLLVPPYDSMKEISVRQINAKIESARVSIGKRIGFGFNSDDVLNVED